MTRLALSFDPAQSTGPRLRNDRVPFLDDAIKQRCDPGLFFGRGGEVCTPIGTWDAVKGNAGLLQSGGRIVAVGFNAPPTRKGVDFALPVHSGLRAKSIFPNE